MNVRRPRPEDLPQVLALLRAADEDVLEESDWTEAELRELWSELDLERDAWLVEVDGRPAGYADFEDKGGGRFVADGYVHPTLRNRGVGGELLRLTEQRALEHAGPVRLQNGALLGGCTPNLYAANGYHAVRHFWRMAVDLDEAPAPAVPAGIEIRTLREGEERAAHAALEEAFADHWEHRARPFEEYAKSTFHRKGADPSLFWLALDGADVAGVALCDWKRSGDWGWVQVLGVRPRWRGRGVGEALLKTAFAEFLRRGERRVALGVDAQNPTGATRLYERVGMRVVMRAVVYEKELRA